MSNELLSKFQRQINRISDSDKATRKMGLKKLNDELPFTSKKERKNLQEVILEHLMKPLLYGISDSVEKCREYSLTIISKSIDILEKESITLIIEDIISKLCSRIGDIPYPEVTEELRLLILTILDKIVLYVNILQSEDLKVKLADIVVNMLPRSLQDAFPAAKKEAAELLCKISSILCFETSICTGFNASLKILTSNAMHQHNKVRTATLKAISAGLQCLSSQNAFQEIMRDSIMPLLLRMLADRSVITRRELATMTAGLLEVRLKSSVFTYKRQAGIMRTSTNDADLPLSIPASGESNKNVDGKNAEDGFGNLGLGSWSGADVELMRLVTMLAGDEAEDVRREALKGLASASRTWMLNPAINNLDLDVDVDEDSNNDKDNGGLDDFDGDAEAAMRSNRSNESKQLKPSSIQEVDNELTEKVSSMDDIELVHTFMQQKPYAHALLVSICSATDNWTTDARCRALSGLNVSIRAIGNHSSLLTDIKLLLGFLGPPLRDDEASVRAGAEMCCEGLGKYLSSSAPVWSTVQKLLLPRALGVSAGSDTASQRTTAIRLLTSLLGGVHPSEEGIPTQDDMKELLEVVAQNALYEHREVYLREAALLLVRALVRCWSSLHQAWYDDIQSNSILVQSRRHLAVALVHLTTRLPGEGSEVSNAAISLTSQLGNHSNTVTERLEALESYFAYILKTIAPTFVGVDSTEGDIELWDSRHPSKGAFDVLLRELPFAAWKHQHLVLPIVIHHVTPAPRADKDSDEAIAASYAAQRGEEEIPDLSDVDIRLSMLASLEGMIRAGAEDWRCGEFIAQGAEVILLKAVVPNLTWRVGRVEATIRKVALATAHGLLRSGAMAESAGALFKAAPHLVPLLASNLDDHDAGPRAIACMCLTSCFQRLKGAFGEDSIRELYPMLLKRLDDSSDQVRLSICSTLESFLVCAPPAYFKGTIIDYTLDQLFIHLDDGDTAIQNAVLKVVVTAARADAIFKRLVEKKADSNRLNHRSPVMCDKVFADLQGYEIVE